MSLAALSEKISDIAYHYFPGMKDSQVIADKPHGAHETDSSPWSTPRESLGRPSRIAGETLLTEPVRQKSREMTEGLEGRTISDSSKSFVPKEGEMKGNEKVNKIRSSERTKVRIQDAKSKGETVMAKELDDCRKRLSQLTADLASKDKMLKDHRDREKALVEEIDGFKGYYAWASKNIQESEIRSQNQAKAFQYLQESSDQTLRLLEIRTSELKGAQAFLGKADSLSGAEVVQMVVTLNSEILQTAALMSETFELDERFPKGGLSTEASDARARIGQSLGNKMVHLLVATKGEDDGILLQIAFQGILVGVSYQSIESWSPDSEDPSIEQALRQIYTTMQETAPQSVFGRWRALTRSNIRRVLESSSLPSSSPESQLVLKSASLLADILVVTGRRARCSEAIETIQNQFGEKLTSLGQLALQLNKAIGTNTTSADLHPLIRQPNDSFDSDYMDDAYATGSARNTGKVTEREDFVLGMTDLGLYRTEKSFRGELERAILLKPKVVLHSVVEELMDM